MTRHSGLGGESTTAEAAAKCCAVSARTTWPPSPRNSCSTRWGSATVASGNSFRTLPPLQSPPVTAEPVRTRRHLMVVVVPLLPWMMLLWLSTNVEWMRYSDCCTIDYTDIYIRDIYYTLWGTIFNNNPWLVWVSIQATIMHKRWTYKLQTEITSTRE